jgi:hypothetical protein
MAVVRLLILWEKQTLNLACVDFDLELRVSKKLTLVLLKERLYLFNITLDWHFKAKHGVLTLEVVQLPEQSVQGKGQVRGLDQVLVIFSEFDIEEFLKRECCIFQGFQNVWKLIYNLLFFEVFDLFSPSIFFNLFELLAHLLSFLQLIGQVFNLISVLLICDISRHIFKLFVDLRFQCHL